MTIKNPHDPATQPQIGAIAKMAAKLGIEPPLAATKGEASAVITQLGEQLDQAKQAKAQTAPAQLPKGSLLAMAAQIEGKTPPPAPAAPAPVIVPDAPNMLTITAAEAKVLLSWYSVMEAETDPTEDDTVLETRLQQFLKPMVDQAPPSTKTELAAAIGQDVPAGRYAIGPDGATEFYKIEYGKTGTQWEGYCFIGKQASDEFWPIKNPASKAAVLNAIRKQGIIESLARYGKELGVCGAAGCGKTLTDPVSIEYGIGPDCRKKLGI